MEAYLSIHSLHTINLNSNFKFETVSHTSQPPIVRTSMHSRSVGLGTNSSHVQEMGHQQHKLQKPRSNRLMSADKTTIRDTLPVIDPYKSTNHRSSFSQQKFSFSSMNIHEKNQSMSNTRVQSPRFSINPNLRPSIIRNAQKQSDYTILLQESACSKVTPQGQAPFSSNANKIHKRFSSSRTGARGSIMSPQRHTLSTNSNSPNSHNSEGHATNFQSILMDAGSLPSCDLFETNRTANSHKSLSARNSRLFVEQRRKILQNQGSKTHQRESFIHNHEKQVNYGMNSDTFSRASTTGINMSTLIDKPVHSPRHTSLEYKSLTERQKLSKQKSFEDNNKAPTNTSSISSQSIVSLLLLSIYYSNR